MRRLRVYRTEYLAPHSVQRRHLPSSLDQSERGQPGTPMQHVLCPAATQVGCAAMVQKHREVDDIGRDDPIGDMNQKDINQYTPHERGFRE